MHDIIRIGKCKQCGLCCWDCVFLNKDNTCSCYNNRPDFCIKEFPRTNQDLIDWGIKNTCGYRFVRV